MVVYLKEGSQIVDLLNVMEAYVSFDESGKCKNFKGDAQFC